MSINRDLDPAWVPEGLWTTGMGTIYCKVCNDCCECTEEEIKKRIEERTITEPWNQVAGLIAD